MVLFHTGLQSSETQRAVRRGIRQLAKADHTAHTLLGQDCCVVNAYDIHSDTSLKFQVKELRKKLRMHGAPEVIETIWGVGYLLCLEDDPRLG